MEKKRWANFPFHPGKWPFFYGWMILVWGTLGMIMSIPGQTIGVSVFTDPLLKTTGISRDELSLAYMFGTMASSFMLPWVGMRYDQFGARPVAMAATLGLGGVLFFFSQVDVVIFKVLKLEGSLQIGLVLFAGFMLLRFFGQGVLTLVSRNMTAQWFEQHRGLATGFSNVFVALTFSSSPVFLYYLINSYTWKGAWIGMAVAAGLVFPLVILIFFRNRPEDSGLVPDGHRIAARQRKRAPLFPVVKEFTLREAIRDYAFWIFALMLAMQGLYITGFTFHVMSIFRTAGLPAETAITIFQPSAILAVVVSLVASIISDYIPLKYLLYVKGAGACVGIVGVIFLGHWPPAYYMLIVGNGLMSGMFSVLSTVCWPRYYGRLHLGAISGQAMMMIVFGSALGPILFSGSLSYFGSYQAAGWICFAVYTGLTVAAVRANNPQIKLAKTAGDEH